MVVVLGAAPPQLLPRELSYRGGLENPSAGVGFSSIPVSSGACRSLGARGRKLRRGAWVQTSAFWQQQKDSPRPDSVEMEPINSSEHLDEILRRCQEEEPHSIVIDWMAAWCRKCIYLTPKLEKLAAEYHTKIKFYYVDVNKVSQALVKRGNISLWKDGEMKAEIIGGHKAWLVVEEVREMIQHNI